MSMHCPPLLLSASQRILMYWSVRHKGESDRFCVSDENLSPAVDLSFTHVSSNTNAHKASSDRRVQLAADH